LPKPIPTGNTAPRFARPRTANLEHSEVQAQRAKDQSVTTFLLAFTALFSIVNPLSGAFIFFGATRELDPKIRAAVSRWVAIYAFSIVAGSLYIGAYVLKFFGISIPVLRVAGGLIVAMSGWRMLNQPDATEQRRNATPAPRSMTVPPSRMAEMPV